MLIPRFKYISKKRLEQLKRGHSTEEYQIWRQKVLERDEHRCQFGACTETTNLEIHHIKRFKDANHLRTAVFNGITLCEKHHRMIYGKESYYELMFLRTVGDNERKQKRNINPDPSGH